MLCSLRVNLRCLRRRIPAHLRRRGRCARRVRVTRPLPPLLPSAGAVLNYVKGAHNVARLLDAAAFAACDKPRATILADENATPYTLPLTAPGVLYFGCGVDEHCANGQKIQVVVGGAGAPGPAPAFAPAPATATLLM